MMDFSMGNQPPRGSFPAPCWTTLTPVSLEKKALLKTTCSVTIFFFSPFYYPFKKDVQYIGFIKKRTFFPRFPLFFLFLCFFQSVFSTKKTMVENSQKRQVEFSSTKRRWRPLQRGDGVVVWCPRRLNLGARRVPSRPELGQKRMKFSDFGGWTNPSIWNISEKLESSPILGVKIEKCFKPPPSFLFAENGLTGSYLTISYCWKWDSN